MKIGDDSFRLYWKRELVQLNHVSARELLVDFMNLIGMPEEVTGESRQTAQLLAAFDDYLAPHDPFWRELADVVNLAFPVQTSSQEGLLERQVHQLRYVISAQQADYVRRHYRKDGMTDGQALASYLAQHRFWTWDLGAFHNKRRRSDGSFPDQLERVNIKIILHYHSEFILSSQGELLSLLEPGSNSQAGRINTASFNYGRWYRHQDLDVHPVGPHDPLCRRRATKGYASAKAGFFHWRLENSLYNKRGLYAVGGQSLAQAIKSERKRFRRLVKQQKNCHNE
ncbi:DUF3114 domain-containing protein [Streptococcus saliviloxodontae]|nr:DUF3114 domain-containing protein [Streptococcus saliviloxodontae]